VIFAMKMSGSESSHLSVITISSDCVTVTGSQARAGASTGIRRIGSLVSCDRRIIETSRGLSWKSWLFPGCATIRS
jgi:hypothetical protein